ncbi:MAG: hypothetical protein JXB05_23210 [Myxococcaceae bacterium]|nr:hypothetical protein [Myxococcaceae bacterium]
MERFRPTTGTQARWKLPLVIGVLGVLLAVLFAVLGGEPSPEAAPSPAVVAAPPAQSSPPSPGPAPRVAAPSGGEAESLDRFLLATPPDESSAEPRNEHPLKLEALEARLPDNLYWKMDAPTKDPQVLQQRAEERRKWNELLGKVQAGDASEEEIHRYYDYRRQRSEDYLEVASLMLTEYGERLSESEKGLIALSIRMHKDRLAEVPRQTEEALARKQLQDKRREEWLRSGKSP